MSAPTVLVIDDDAVLVDIVAAVLQEEGYHVERASSVAEAQALLRAHRPDAFALVLSDTFATDTDPYWWLDQVRGLSQGAIVICSGWPPALYADYGARGFAAFLAKPFDLDDLVAVVAERSGRPHDDLLPKEPDHQ